MKTLRAAVAIEVRASASPPTNVSTHGTALPDYNRTKCILKLTLSAGAATSLVLWGVVDGDWCKLTDVNNLAANVGGDGASWTTAFKYAIELSLDGIGRIALQKTSDAVTVTANLYDVIDAGF